MTEIQTWIEKELAVCEKAPVDLGAGHWLTLEQQRQVMPNYPKALAALLVATEALENAASREEFYVDADGMECNIDRRKDACEALKQIEEVLK